MIKFTIKQFRERYPDDDACLLSIMNMRHGGTEIECPACKRASKFSKITNRRAYACQHCGHHVYPCAGSIFEKSRTPLTLWFYAMYLMTTTRHGVPAKELERQLGVTYKTAWRMAHELRKLMTAADTTQPLTGIVEADESYFGGKVRGKGVKAGLANKTIVLGMVERDGPVRAGPIPFAWKGIVQNYVKQNVQRGSILVTDDAGIYSGIRLAPYRHFRVNHSAGEYVRGNVHTNTIEGYWSRLKNSIRGTHVHVSSKHLSKYVAEFSFRYNMRKEPGAMFGRLVKAFALPRLAGD